MRRFIAFEVESNKNIEEVYNFFKDKGKLSEFKHVTLSFLGDTQIDINYIKEFFRDKKIIEVVYKGLGGFPRLDYSKVIWVGVKLSYDIMEGFKYGKNDVYHLTIARSKFPINLINYTKKFDYILGVQTVKTIKLFRTVIPGKEYYEEAIFYLNK